MKVDIEKAIDKIKYCLEDLDPNDTYFECPHQCGCQKPTVISFEIRVRKEGSTLGYVLLLCEECDTEYEGEF